LKISLNGAVEFNPGKEIKRYCKISSTEVILIKKDEDVSQKLRITSKSQLDLGVAMKSCFSSSINELEI
jgi:hypothetical protein